MFIALFLFGVVVACMVGFGMILWVIFGAAYAARRRATNPPQTNPEDGRGA